MHSKPQASLEKVWLQMAKLYGETIGYQFVNIQQIKKTTQYISSTTNFLVVALNSE